MENRLDFPLQLCGHHRLRDPIAYGRDGGFIVLSSRSCVAWVLRSSGNLYELAIRVRQVCSTVGV
jgi:hypothetical protein